MAEISAEKQKMIDDLADRGTELINTFKDKSGELICPIAHDYSTTEPALGEFLGEGECFKEMKTLFNSVTQLNDVEKLYALGKILHEIDLTNNFKVKDFEYGGGMVDFWSASIQSL